MNFDFKEILEMFKGHWRFFALLILVGALVGAFVIVPVAQSYFGSERQSCGKCLDENQMLLIRMMEISALARRLNEANQPMVMSGLNDTTIYLPPPERFIIEKIQDLAEE